MSAFPRRAVTRRLYKADIVRSLLRFTNRFQLLCNRTLFRSTSLNVYKLGSMELIAIREDDLTEVANSQMYWPLLKDVLPRTGLRVLDYGANVGAFALMLWHNGIVLERVHAIEMNPHTFRRLRYNLEESLPCEVSLSNKAVMGNLGRVTVRVGRGSSGDSAVKHDARKLEIIQVECTTIDASISEAFGAEGIDLCKMDVEGAEHDIFAHNNYSRLRQCKLLIMELHDLQSNAKGKTEDVISKLSLLGFEELETANGTRCPVRLLRNRNPLG